MLMLRKFVRCAQFCSDMAERHINVTKDQEPLIPSMNVAGRHFENTLCSFLFLIFIKRFGLFEIPRERKLKGNES